MATFFDDTVAEVVSLAVAVMVPNAEILNSLAVETLETVIFVGEDAISCKIKIEHVSNVLEAIENGRNISIEMRNDRAYQMQNRMHTYDVIMSEGWHRDFVPIVASDVLWLTLNHYFAGRWLTDLLDETVKRHGFAVLSISIGYPTEGRVDGTAWGSRSLTSQLMSAIA